MSNRVPNKCKKCDNYVKWNYPLKIWRTYCSPNCAQFDKKEQILKRNITNLEKYGSNNPLNNVDVNKKRKSTMMGKYGVEYSGQSVELTDKRKETMLDNYGVEHNWQHGDLREKQQQTMLDLYGSVVPIHNEITKEKIKQTMLSRYGVEFAQQNADIREKRRQTNLIKYGVTYPHQQHMIDIIPLISNYDWLVDQYINQNKTATQIAFELGSTQETICRYLKDHEITIRNFYTYSYKCILWLEGIMTSEEIYIQHAHNEGEFQISGTKYKADGYCKNTNTIYEFHGDYWHGNPNVYSSDYYNNTLDKTAGELYQKTVDRENQIIRLGYNLVVMWESDYTEIQIDIKGGV